MVKNRLEKLAVCLRCITIFYHFLLPAQHSDNDCPQQPHSTKQESSTKKHVSSQLQSLLQLHLQRSLAASNAMQAGLTTTAMSTTKCVASSSSLVHSMSETKSSGQVGTVMLQSKLFHFMLVYTAARLFRRSSNN